MKLNLRRCWINQPSTRQPLHRFHGTNGLAGYEREGTEVFYFLTGDAICMEVSPLCLSNGWVKSTPPEKTKLGLGGGD